MRIGIQLLLLCLANCLFSQQNQSNFLIGMGIDLQKSKLEVFATDWERYGLVDLENIEVKESPGARFHVDFYYKLGHRASLRCSPSVFFQKNEVNFILRDRNNVSVKIMPLGLGIPLYYQYAPQGLHKGPRFFVGAEFQRLLGTYDKAYISLYNYNMLGKIGVAVPFTSKWIKWMPSLTYGMGLENLKKFEDEGMLNNAINTIQLNTIQLGISIFLVSGEKEKVD